MKYLLLALAIYLGWRWLSASRAAGREPPDSSGEVYGSGSDSGSGVERMVKCPECGLHLPVSDALPGPDHQFFCSEAHRDTHRA